MRIWVLMPDVLIRGISTDDLARLDEHAARLGISRSEYLRRQLRQEARRNLTLVTPTDLHDFSHDFADLGEPGVMADAWS